MKSTESNLHRFLTTSAFFAMAEFFCLTNLAPMAKAEDINVSNGNELIEAIQKAGINTVNLQNDITVTGNLGSLVGGQLMIDGGENNKFSISGTYQENETEKHYGRIAVGDGKTLIINNVGSVDDNGNIIKSWNGFARNVTDYADGYVNVSADGGTIDTSGIVTITDSTFSNNFVSVSAYAYDNPYADSFANAYAFGGAISNTSRTGTVEINNSTFSNNFATATATADDNPSVYINAFADASADGGAIYNNDGTVTITDSSFSGNYAKAAAIFRNNAKGGAIYNSSGVVNIIASSKDSVFSGNYTQIGEEKTNNDICNYGETSTPGTINLYAASGKTISFGGGIQSEGYVGYHSVNINVQGETSYDVDGTVLFKTGSINSRNNFTLGAGTLKIENGVSWEYNSLVMNGGTLDIGNSPGVLNYKGGALTLNEGANIYIDILGAQAGTQYDQIVFSNGADFILNGGKLNVNLGYDAQEGTLFEIMKDFSWSGTTFDENCVEVLNAPEGWSSDRHFVASLGEVRGDTRSLFLEVIPEPSAVGLFVGSLAFTLVGMRRRKK